MFKCCKRRLANRELYSGLVKNIIRTKQLTYTDEYSEHLGLGEDAWIGF